MDFREAMLTFADYSSNTNFLVKTNFLVLKITEFHFIYEFWTNTSMVNYLNSCIRTCCVANLSISTRDTVKAADWLSLPNSLPGARLTVFTAH